MRVSRCEYCAKISSVYHRSCQFFVSWKKYPSLFYIIWVLLLGWMSKGRLELSFVVGVVPVLRVKMLFFYFRRSLWRISSCTCISCSAPWPTSILMESATGEVTPLLSSSISFHPEMVLYRYMSSNYGYGSFFRSAWIRIDLIHRARPYQKL